MITAPVLTLKAPLFVPAFERSSMDAIVFYGICFFFLALIAACFTGNQFKKKAR